MADISKLARLIGGTVKGVDLSANSLVVDSIKIGAGQTELTETILTDLIAGGGGSGGINYIDNSDAETDTTGYATYADAAGTSPVDGTGGSATTTFTRTTSSPLRGTGSFLITKDAANRQGEGASYDFTIDSADKAKILRVSFDYESSANYADGDIKVFIYDVTNSSLIEVIDRDIKANSFGSFVGSFQTSSNSTSYRLILHVSSTNASAYTLKMDSITIGPQTLIKGSLTTDWETFTPTGTWTTNTSYIGRYRRVGDSAEIKYQVSVTGAPDATALLLDIPSFLGQIDTSKLPSTSSILNLGVGTILDSGSATYFVEARYNSATQFQLRQNGLQVSNTVPMTWANGDIVEVTIKVPILGWASNVTLSEDSGNRIIAATYQRSGAQSLPSGSTTILAYNSKVIDTHLAVSGGIFTAPETGYYSCAASCRLDKTGSWTVGNQLELFVFVNGVNKANLGFLQIAATNSYSEGLSGTALVFAEKGQSIDFRVFHNGGANVATGGGTQNNMSIYKIQSPQTLAGSETVAASYDTNAGQSVVSGNTVIFEDLNFDTHGSYNTSTGEFTVPVSGVYELSATTFTNALSSSAGQYYSTRAVQTGSSSVTRYFSQENMYSTTTTNKVSTGTAMFNCKKGDVLKVQFDEDIAATTLVASGALNYISIKKIG